MADNRRYGLSPQLDIGQILLEAKNRWLRPTEVCEILRNYRKFHLAPDPPHKPTDGSLFLFDRKALRYFRKDGLNWRKKKDGKTVREAHERLKAGSVDVLHCYYAHGEDNENFQRRSYWMLEEEYEHIVLVHYREVKEGNKAGIVRSTNTERLLPIANSGGQIALSACSTQAHSSSLLAQTTYASSPSTAEWNGPTHSSEFEEPESGDDVGASSLAEAECSSEDRGSFLRQPNINEELVVDSGGRLPKSYLKDFTGLLAENKGNYSSFNVNEVGLGQYSFLELHPPVQGNFLNQDDVSQLDIPLQNSCLSGYSRGETSNLGRRQGLERGNYAGIETPSSAMTLDLSGCKYLLGQGKNASTAEIQVSNGHDIDSSTWTEVLEQSTAELLNVAHEPKVPCMQAMTSEDITERQTHVMIEAFVRELSERQQTFPDVYLHDPSRAVVQTRLEHMGSQKLTSNSPLWNVDQRETGESGFESLNAFQQKKFPCSDSQQFQLPADQHNNEQRKLQLQDNDNSELLRNKYLLSPKLEAANDLDLEKNMVCSEIPKQFLQECSFQAEGQEGLKKLDSFGRWMSREIGRDGEDSLVASDSGMYWNTLESQNGVEEVSSLSHQIHLDVDLMGPSLSQDQLFSISDFSPDWAYPEQGTKVLIIGTFLGRLKTTHDHKLGCMFGEIEVSAEILSPGVLRCQAPPHVPGRVPFYVTCSNRLACSEVREFEYRAGPFQDMNARSNMDAEAVDEMLLQIRFVKSLSLYFDKGQSFLCIKNEDESSSLSRKIHSLIKDSDEEWSHLEISTKHSGPNPEKSTGNLMEKLLKEKLYAWLLWKTDEGKTPNTLDDQGQGVIHMAAALGYSWAIGPIVAAGVNINFRDVHGWTALHWAAFCGREQTVVALIALGAAPGALTDPTQKFAAGRTPADLASSRGHKGIAGYLAESSLTSHLSSLTIKENIMGSMSATLAGEKAVETVAERTVVQCDKAGRDDQLSLKDSLAAVRNAAQAAARIQSAFRARSFRVRQLIEYGDDKCGMSDEEALSLVSVQTAHKLSSNDEPLHTAAIRIQRKFRGWKGRKEFLIIRQRIVKIQAHVRGHQVRKHYKKIIWSVGIVEKAILRWRRKGAGLRGFRAEGVIEDSNAQNGGQNESDDYDFLRAGRKQTEAGLEKALARVQSMVQYPEARDQYRRLLTTFQETKVDFEGTADGESPKLSECQTNEEDALMSITD